MAASSKVSLNTRSMMMLMMLMMTETVNYLSGPFRCSRGVIFNELIAILSVNNKSFFPFLFLRLTICFLSQFGLRDVFMGARREVMRLSPLVSLFL